ncbi:DNA sulfur modification protein DndD [Candidatus Poribacteria bacterium]|nr:DNA sulfur modification protein DndD [Candidatus Poribacteria bacterium]
MIFHQLTLDNFGLFCGRQTLSLTPRIKYSQRRPVILIGGKNGSGKTTLLEAVRLCLYGARSLGNRVSQKEYHEYLASAIHHSQSSLFQLTNASVALEFEHVHSGIKDCYHVERKWKICTSSSLKRAPDRVEELLVIHKNNVLLSEFEAGQWQDFLSELIPIGLSQLFFFDGEKIQALAEDTSSNTFLADSIKSLLGVDLVERLQSDLLMYLNRSKKVIDSDGLAKDISQVEEELQSIENQRRVAMQYKEQIEGRIAELETQIAHQEERIAQEGGGYARQREKLKAQQEQLIEKISALEKQIQDACNGLFPFALVPSLCEQLRERLIKEAELEQWNSAQRLLKERNRALLERLDGEILGELMPGNPLSPTLRDSIRSKIAGLLTEQLQPPEHLKDFYLIHHLSPPESRRLLSWIDSCLTDIPTQFQEMNRKLEESNRQLEQVEAALQKAPSDEVLQPLMQALAGLHQQLGALQKQAQDETTSIQSLTYHHAEIERKVRRLKEEKQKREADIQRVQTVEQVQSVLEEYASRLTYAKVEALKRTVADCFNQLCHKRNLVKRIEIHPQTFAVTLYDGRSAPLPRRSYPRGKSRSTRFPCCGDWRKRRGVRCR